MSAIPTLLIDRFRRLPRRSSEAWQGGFVRLPDWVDAGPDGKPYRPWAAVWVSLTTGVMNVKIDPAPGARDWTVALDALLELGLKRAFAGCRPARLEVADEPLGRQIADRRPGLAGEDAAGLLDARRAVVGEGRPHRGQMVAGSSARSGNGGSARAASPSRRPTDR